MSIKAIFYSKFDTQEGKFPIQQPGPKVIHQVPEGSIVPSSDPNDGPPFFSFTSISSFIIPRQSLCGNLISLVPPPPQTASKHSSQPPSPSYRILGHPICLTSSAYPRNEFIFNFCLVLSATDPDFNAYKSVVTKLAHLMLSLEEQSHFLSRDTSPQNSGKLYALCETLISDLNNYCECMIPIDNLNTLNLKLFPTYAPPPPVKAWHVPIFTVRPESLMDENWDLTMQRIVPHINGISSVKHISILADADLGLTKQCIKHLLYYGCLLLLDIFSFTAIYAPTADFATSIASDGDMQRECARYVNTAFAPMTTADKLDHVVNQPDVPITGDDIWPLSSTGKAVDGVGIVELFAALKQGQSVREWYTANSDMLANIDLRRFITFGVIKGFVYRVHKYAFATNHSSITKTPHSARNRDGRGGSGKIPALTFPFPEPAGQHRGSAANIPVRNASREIHLSEAQSPKAHDKNGDDGPAAPNPTDSHHRHHSHPHNRSRQPTSPGSTTDTSSSSTSSPSSSSSDEKPSKSHHKHEHKHKHRNRDRATARLARYLDGAHPFDQICTELEISEGELEGRLRGWGLEAGEVVIIHR